MLHDGFDLANPTAGFYLDPYPTYAALRVNQPRKRLLSPAGAASVFLTRYDDVVATYRLSGAVASSDKKTEFFPKFGNSPLFEHHTSSLVFNDPPLHTRVRKLLMGAMNQRSIQRMEQGVTRLVDDLLDHLVQKPEADLINEFCAAIPVEVIGNLLAIPHSDRAPLRGWSLAILAALEPTLTPQMQAAGNTAVSEFLSYLKQLVADRTKHPSNPDEDVLTRLIVGEAGTKTDAMGNERLTETELLHNCIFLLNAGHETTTNTLGNGFNALLDYPEQWARLKENPSLIPTAVEEILRFDSPLQLNNRRLLADTVIGGELFPAGYLVTLGVGAANRDPEEFSQPDLFDVGRKPNRHLAFGHSDHACAGMNVARMEVRIALARFVSRFRAIERAASPVRDLRVRFRGLNKLSTRLKAS
jgi:cytochrome P450